MGFENRFEGNKAWMWAEPESRKVKYQFFVFEDKKKAEANPPPNVVVVRAVFNGNEWVEFVE